MHKEQLQSMAPTRCHVTPEEEEEEEDEDEDEADDDEEFT